MVVQCHSNTLAAPKDEDMIFSLTWLSETKTWRPKMRFEVSVRNMAGSCIARIVREVGNRKIRENSVGVPRQIISTI